MVDIYPYSDPALSGGGPGHLQITHSAALTLFVIGLRPEKVCAYMNNSDLPVDLIDAVSVRFEGRAVGAFAGTGNIRPGDSVKISDLYERS